MNQLLDFRKMEVNELKLHTRQGDVLKFVKDISYSFIDLAETKNISFAFHSSAESFVTMFDHDKLERILFNLLSNAFKFTPENGAVGVEVAMEKDKKGEGSMILKVKDNGIGIPAGKQEKNRVNVFFRRRFPIPSLIREAASVWPSRRNLLKCMAAVCLLKAK